MTFFLLFALLLAALAVGLVLAPFYNTSDAKGSAASKSNRSRAGRGG